MKNQKLANDYITRASKRISSLKALMNEESWADVVREAQESVELALKALLRHSNIETPRIHDVSDVLQKHKDLIDQKIHPYLDRLCEISRELRRDRELAFYGTEDLTPSEFYKKKDAELALEYTEFVVSKVKGIFTP